MPIRCCVPGCRSNYRKTCEYVTVYSFPKNENLRKKWCEAINRPNWVPGKFSMVCKNHFEDDDIISNVRCYDKKKKVHVSLPLLQTRLRENAVPSLFDDLCPVDPVSKRIIRRRNPVARRGRRLPKVVFSVNEDKLKLLKKRVKSMIHEMDPDGTDNSPKKVHLRKMLGFLGVKAEDGKKSGSQSLGNVCTRSSQRSSKVSGKDKKQQNTNEEKPAASKLSENTSCKKKVSSQRCTNCKVPPYIKENLELESCVRVKSKSLIRPGMVPSKITLRIVNALQQLITSNCKFRPVSVNDNTVTGTSTKPNMVVVKSSSGFKEETKSDLMTGSSSENPSGTEADSVKDMEDTHINSMVLYITKEVVDGICGIYNNIKNYEPFKSGKKNETSKYLQITKHFNFYVSFVESDNEESSTCVISTNPMTELSISCTYRCNRPFEKLGDEEETSLKVRSNRKSSNVDTAKTKNVNEKGVKLIESPDKYYLRRKRINYKLLASGENSEVIDSETNVKPNNKTDITCKRKLPPQQHNVKRRKFSNDDFEILDDMIDRVYIDTDTVEDDDDVILYHKLVSVDKDESKIDKTMYSSKNPPNFNKEIRIILERCDKLFLKKEYMDNKRSILKNIFISGSREDLDVEETIDNIKMFIEGNLGVNQVSASTCSSVNKDSLSSFIFNEGHSEIKTEVDEINKECDENLDQVEYKRTDLVSKNDSDKTDFVEIYINDVKTIDNFDDINDDDDNNVVPNKLQFLNDDISDRSTHIEKEIIKTHVNNTNKVNDECNAGINSCEEEISENKCKDTVSERSIVNKKNKVRKVSCNRTNNMNADEIIIDLDKKKNNVLHELRKKCIENISDVETKSKKYVSKAKKKRKKVKSKKVDYNNDLQTKKLDSIDKSSNNLVNKSKVIDNDKCKDLDEERNIKQDENKNDKEVIEKQGVEEQQSIGVSDSQNDSLVSNTKKSVDENLDKLRNVKDNPTSILITNNMNKTIESKTSNSTVKNKLVLDSVQSKIVKGLTNEKPCEEQIDIVTEANKVLNVIVNNDDDSENRSNDKDVFSIEEALRRIDESNCTVISDRCFDVGKSYTLHDLLTLHSKETDDNVVSEVDEDIEIIHRDIEWIVEDFDDVGDDLVSSSSSDQGFEVELSTDEDFEVELRDVDDVVEIDDDNVVEENNKNTTLGDVEYVIKLDDNYTMIKDGVLTKSDFREVVINNDDITEVEVVSDNINDKDLENNNGENIEGEFEKAVECTLCNKMIHKSSIGRHTARHLGGKFCPYCSKSFTDIKVYRGHVASHKEPSDKEKYKCAECDRRFCFLKNFIKHLKKSHPNCDLETSVVMLDDKNETSLDLDDKKVTCEYCSQRFNRYYYKRHVLIHTGERPFGCNICNKRFSEKGSLTHHMRVHTFEKPYKCNFCNKAFSHSSTLSKHRNIHTGEKTFMCEICGKELTNMFNLNCHMRSHTGEKPFHCELCNKGFSFKNSMQKHMAHCSGSPPLSPIPPLSPRSPLPEEEVILKVEEVSITSFPFP